jgi:intraflagellar transport protein 172
MPAGNETNRIAAMAWSPDRQKLAVAAADRFIQLFDERGEKKEKFSTKPVDPKDLKAYRIVGLAFSPDSTKLAVAQSDCVVYIYKLGLGWGEKKSICNKFIQSSEITCLIWPRKQPNAVVFGQLDGKVIVFLTKVRIGNLKTNKAASLMSCESCVVSITSDLDGNAIMSGHYDGTINRFFFDDTNADATQGKFTVHSSTPEILIWGETVMAAGTDQIITVYDNKGKSIQKFDYSKSPDFKNFTVAELSPSGKCAVFGPWRIRIGQRLKQKSLTISIQFLPLLGNQMAQNWRLEI